MNASFRVEDGLQQLESSSIYDAARAYSELHMHKLGNTLNKGNDKGSGRTKDRLDMTMYKS